jgi:non-ribosomal peptide synthetase component E (peptide arylation enzyme)
MNKAHVTIFALLVAGATLLGAVAVTRTTGLGRAARHTNDAAIAARTKQLGAYAAKLQKELKAKPPALPAVPKPKPSPAAAATAAPAQQPAPRIVYHRPPPVVTVVHRHHGDDGSHESEGGGDGGGDD